MKMKVKLITFSHQKQKSHQRKIKGSPFETSMTMNPLSKDWHTYKGSKWSKTLQNIIYTFTI